VEVDPPHLAQEDRRQLFLSIFNWATCKKFNKNWQKTCFIAVFGYIFF